MTKPRILLALLPLAAFAGLAVFFAAGLRHDPTVVPSALVERPVPDFTLAGLPGKPGFATADLKGKASLLNVFASWCAPCKEEHPLLLRLSHEQGVPVRGLVYKDDPAGVAAWLERQGDPYLAVGVDPDSRAALDLGVYGVPETFVVDATGRIRYRLAGPLTPEFVEGTLLPLLRSLKS